jgi:hypothetical protein
MEGCYDLVSSGTRTVRVACPWPACARTTRALCYRPGGHETASRTVPRCSSSSLRPNEPTERGACLALRTDSIVTPALTRSYTSRDLGLNRSIALPRPQSWPYVSAPIGCRRMNLASASPRASGSCSGNMWLVSAIDRDFCLRKERGGRCCDLLTEQPNLPAVPAFQDQHGLPDRRG